MVELLVLKSYIGTRHKGEEGRGNNPVITNIYWKVYPTIYRKDRKKGIISKNQKISDFIFGRYCDLPKLQIFFDPLPPPPQQFWLLPMHDELCQLSVFQRINNFCWTQRQQGTWLNKSTLFKWRNRKYLVKLIILNGIV